MKQKLIFDVSDTNTIADSDSVGAFLRASDGTLLTHTDVGGKKALDVRVAEGINVEVDLSHVDDSVRLGDGTDLFTGTTEGAKVGLDVNLINPSIAVTATDLDIRDLTQSDEITVFQGTSPWVVSATDLDIRDLDAAQDSIQSNTFDGAGNAISSTSGALDVYITGSDPLTINDAALANTAIAAASNDLAVADTAEDAVASPLAARKYLFIHNNGNRQIFVGQSGVSSANGFPLSPGSTLELRAGAAIDIEWVGPNTNQQIRTLELS
jgi:hypothetical protein